MNRRLRIRTTGRGFYPLTDKFNVLLKELGIHTGVLVAFALHTSASLVVQEKADPTSKRDMERFMTALEEHVHYEAEHTAESPDDSMSHVRSVLTGTSHTFLIDDGQLLLGQWQGVFLWEHRHESRWRDVAVTIISDD